MKLMKEKMYETSSGLQAPAFEKSHEQFLQYSGSDYTTI
jgi:hypothetical protein